MFHHMCPTYLEPCFCIKATLGFQNQNFLLQHHHNLHHPLLELDLYQAYLLLDHKVNLLYLVLLKDRDLLYWDTGLLYLRFGVSKVILPLNLTYDFVLSCKFVYVYSLGKQFNAANSNFYVCGFNIYRAISNHICNYYLYL